MTKLSVLDQSPVRKGGSPAQAIRETAELARYCDDLGFHRYWVAEHHNSAALAGTTPEILVGHLAGLTKQIRIGSGGVMLSHYSPLKVAENFRMLETLYPGRIDLGIGRAPGSDHLTAQALAAGPGSLSHEYFPHQVNSLRQFLHDEVPAEDNFAKVHAEPRGDGAPMLWLLGSSGPKCDVGGLFRPAVFLRPFHQCPWRCRRHALLPRQYRPSAAYPTPEGSIGIFVICAESEAEAEHLALSRNIFLINLRRGQPAPVVSPEEAATYRMDAADRAIVADAAGRTIVGTPATCKLQSKRCSTITASREAVVVTITYDFEARKRSYLLLAEALGYNRRHEQPRY